MSITNRSSAFQYEVKALYTQKEKANAGIALWLPERKTLTDSTFEALSLPRLPLISVNKTLRYRV